MSNASPQEQTKSTRKQAARAFIERVRAKQQENKTFLGGPSSLSNVEEAQNAVTMMNMSRRCKFNSASEAEVVGELLSRFEKMCARNDVDYPENLRPEIAKILREELVTNCWTLGKTKSAAEMEKYSRVTLHCGDAPSRAIGMKEYSVLSDYIFVFNRAINSNAASYFDYLDKVAENVNLYKDKDEYAILRNAENEDDDTLLYITRIAAYNPTDTKFALGAAANLVKGLENNPRYENLENAQRHFIHAAAFYPQDYRNHLDGILIKQDKIEMAANLD